MKTQLLLTLTKQLSVKRQAISAPWVYLKLGQVQPPLVLVNAVVCLGPATQEQPGTLPAPMVLAVPGHKLREPHFEFRWICEPCTLP